MPDLLPPLAHHLAVLALPFFAPALLISVFAVVSGLRSRRLRDDSASREGAP